MHCCHEGCAQPANYWVGLREEDAVHACADHVDDLRRGSDSVFRLDPRTGEVGELIKLPGERAVSETN